MSDRPFDPAQFKTEEQQRWDLVAAGWKTWWPVLERGAQGVCEALLDLGGVRPGQRVLDVATGIGEPCVSAARRVGPSGRITATDFSPQMLAIARERAEALGLRNVEFLHTDGEALDVPGRNFDAVLSRWGLMFFPDLPAALRRIHGLLRKGGRLAAAVWDAPDRVPMLKVAKDVATRELQLPAPPPGMPGPFSLADTAALERALRDAGFSGIRVERAAVTLEWESAEAYTRMMVEIAAPIVALLQKAPPARREQVLRATADAARAYAQPDGRVRMTNQAICVGAEK